MEFSASPFSHPEERLPGFDGTADDQALLQGMLDCLGNGQNSAASPEHIARLFGRSSFPQHFDRLVMVLYAPGHPRIMVSRAGQSFGAVFELLLQHPRRGQLVGGPYRIQLDFIVAPPEPVDLYAIGMQRAGDRHFEVGVDGLLYRGPDGKVHLFLPGDAYVRSVMTMGQLRERLNKIHGEAYVRQASFFRLRSESYLSAKGSWLPLYRGYPTVGALTREKLEHALELGVNHIQDTQDEQGKFLYYYDAALDSRRDHEHPGRNPDRNPYYNILRHCGGGLTCLYSEKWTQSGQTLENIRRAIEYLIATSFRTTSYAGREGAYVYSERKAKLGGAGIALYLLADYQMLSGDDRYRGWADKLAWHLINQVTASGEFIYYNIYLDREISEAENQSYFSFYYPGEAVCGLAKYLHLVDAEGRKAYFEKLRQALHFLLVERPLVRADQYTAIPSDSWLMMGIMELWDFPEMRDAAYADFVFRDARQMVDHMYKVGDAPYPDYAGAFYYAFGDYPYADGARCEGLLGAYALAEKMGDGEKMRELWPALRLAAWSLMHLVNTEDAIYSAPNPAIALGGIRFKYTRQWFRIDTIQHVASFFAKLLALWDVAESSIISEG
jgi:hypothetical protein